MAEQIDDDLWQQEPPDWCLMEEAHHGDVGNIIDAIEANGGAVQNRNIKCLRCSMCNMDIATGPGPIIGKILFTRMSARSKDCPSPLNTVIVSIKANDMAKNHQGTSKFKGFGGFIRRGR